MDWKKEIAEAREQLANQKMSYKDKPVNGEPTNKQINYLKSLCRKEKLKVSIIGLNRREARELISYLLGEEKKPTCYKQYIKER